jgi:hypothetical protein
MIVNKAAAAARDVTDEVTTAAARDVTDEVTTTAAAAADDDDDEQPKRLKRKLTLEQKRELVLTWFTSQEDAPALRIKDLPNGKAFVRRAAKDLKLSQLRTIRLSADEAQKASIDDMARRRVLSYRPRQFAAAAAQEPQTSAAPTAKIATTSPVDPGHIRSILLAFYGTTGPDAVPLGRHLRNCGVLHQKRDVLAIVRAIGLRRMKRDCVSVEEATAKLDAALSNLSAAAGGKGADALADACADRLDAMRMDGAAPAVVGGSKAQRQATRIAARRAQRKAQRQAMVEAKRARRIVHKQQHEQQQQADKAIAILRSNPPLLKIVQSDDTQALLMEWYVDPSKPSIVDFLQSKEKMGSSIPFSSSSPSSLLDTYKRPLRLLVKAGQLQRLRKAGAGRGKAARAIEDVLARASTSAQKGVVAKVSLKKSPAAAAAAAIAGFKQDDLQNYLVEWFHDDNMPSVGDYLAANGLPSNLRPAMAHMITQLGLRRLRKDRRMASVRALRRINGALKGNKGGIGASGKKNTTEDVPTHAAILPSAPPAELFGEEGDYVSVSKEDEEMAEDAPPSHDDAITAKDKIDLGFVVLH